MDGLVCQRYNAVPDGQRWRRVCTSQAQQLIWSWETAEVVEIMQDETDLPCLQFAFCHSPSHPCRCLVYGWCNNML